MCSKNKFPTPMRKRNEHELEFVLGDPNVDMLCDIGDLETCRYVVCTNVCSSMGS